jgi:beta-N-acetylhexosaminidase
MLIRILLYLFWFPLLAASTQLSLEEKVGQLLMVHFNGSEVNQEATNFIQKLHVGGFIYYNWSNELSSPGQIKKLSQDLQNLAKIPLLISTDQEGGMVSRLKNGFTTYPSNYVVAQTQDPNTAKNNAYQMGKEMLAVGINMDLAPVVDVNSNPNNPSIGDRSYGSDPQIVTLFGRYALEGFKNANVIATLKHFPGYGDVQVDPHAGLPVVNKSKEELEKVELYPYYQLTYKAPAIMTAHIMLPALDKDNCATLSKAILTNLLRDQIGFKGLIISDSLVMQGVLKQAGSVDEAAIRSINAGCDMLILGGKQLLSTQSGLELTYDDVARIHKNIVIAVQEGRISVERLDDAVAHVLQLKESLQN